MKFITKSNFILAAIILANLVTVKLYFENNLTLYIHPRYVLFTMIMNCISLVIVCMLIVTMIAKKAHTAPRGISLGQPSIVALLLAFLVIAGLIFPAKSLSSTTVNQRTITTNIDGEPVCPDIDESSPPKEFQDWDRLLSGCDEPLKYQGRSIVIEGFVYDGHGLNAQDTFSVARFKISCCAVDAQPMLLTIAEQDWSSRFKANQWLHIEGSVQPKWVNEKLTAVVEPKNIKKISQPQDPYDFLKF